ncbi:hypothetical protein MASR1M66_20280 [Aminivibrio sp.]
MHFAPALEYEERVAKNKTGQTAKGPGGEASSLFVLFPEVYCEESFFLTLSPADADASLNSPSASAAAVL